MKFPFLADEVAFWLAHFAVHAPATITAEEYEGCLIYHASNTADDTVLGLYIFPELTPDEVAR